MAGAKAVLLLIASAAIVSANPKAPPPEFNGCYEGRDDGSINAQAVFDMGGVRGYVQFYQPNRGEATEINVNLQGLEAYSGLYPWHAHDFPVRNGLLRDNACSNAEVGGHYDPLNRIDDPDYSTNCNPFNATSRLACEVGDFSGKLGPLRNDQVEQTFMDDTLNLFGPHSVVGRSLVIHYPEDPQDRFVCANIEPVGCNVKNLRATFDNGILEGSVYIRYTSGRDSAKIFTSLTDVDVQGNISSFRTWSLHRGQAGDNNTCAGVSEEIGGLERQNPEHFDCSVTNHRGCGYGDLTNKCGALSRVGSTTEFRACCTDTQLGLFDITTLSDPGNGHFLSVRVMDGDIVEGCATFEKVPPQVGKVHFNNGKEIFGTVYFTQASIFDRTFIQTYLGSVRRRDVFLTVRENPVVDKNNCSDAALGAIYQKQGGTVFGRPLRATGGIKTGDHFLPGSLISAIPVSAGSQRVSTRTSSHYVPVAGPFSIIGRSVVVTERRANDEFVNLACGNIING